jgi:hypothetical protein
VVDLVLLVSSARQSNHSVVTGAASAIIASASATAVDRVLAKDLGAVSDAPVHAAGLAPEVHAVGLAVLVRVSDVVVLAESLGQEVRGLGLGQEVPADEDSAHSDGDSDSHHRLRHRRPGTGVPTGHPSADSRHRRDRRSSGASLPLPPMSGARGHTASRHAGIEVTFLKPSLIL